MVNNLLNVSKLDTKGDVVTDLGGRFKYAWEVNQFVLAEPRLQRD
jgi:iron complex outermembrane receptor protein